MPQEDDISTILQAVGVKRAVRLASRRNKVFRALMRDGSQCIVKIYSPELRHRLPLERSVLEKASVLRHGEPIVRVPELLGEYCEPNGAALLIEYVPGENLCDVLNQDISLGRETPGMYMRALAQWYSGFHGRFSASRGTTLLRGDSILRNFIVSEKKPGPGARFGPGRDTYSTAGPDTCFVVGVDFEQAREGDPAADIGEICCSILDTHPMFTAEKVGLCRELIEAYTQLSGYKDIRRIQEEIASSMKVVASRRPRQKHIIQKKLAIFQKEGFCGLVKDVPEAAVCDNAAVRPYNASTGDQRYSH